MNGYYQTLNSFLEDTCVIVVIAYLLKRGRMLSLLFQEKRTIRQTLYMGAIFGLFGMIEALFPGARYPYGPKLLIVIFAAIMAGAGPALVAAALIAMASFVQHAPLDVLVIFVKHCVGISIGVWF